MEKINGIVDVSQKKETQRIAKARSFVFLGKELVKKIELNEMPKGNILEIARVAGIMAVKKTQELIPHCHNIFIESAGIEFLLKEDGLVIESVVKTTAKTGVEMEALVACSIAALTIYDTCKMFSKSIEIKDIYLIEKQGGKSGVYRRSVQ